MTASTDEIEILDAARAWETSQALFLHGADETRTRFHVACGHYDEVLDPNVGACCLVRQGSDLEELVGEFVIVTFLRVKLYLYCVGGAPLDTDVALTRRAFMELAPLWTATVPVYVQATT